MRTSQGSEYHRLPERMRIINRSSLRKQSLSDGTQTFTHYNHAHTAIWSSSDEYFSPNDSRLLLHIDPLGESDNSLRLFLPWLEGRLLFIRQ